MAPPKSRGICSITGCGRPHLARGWCRVHYYRWHRTGTTELLGHPKGEAHPRYIDGRKAHPLYTSAGERWWIVARTHETSGGTATAGAGVRVCQRWMGAEGLAHFIDRGQCD